MESCESLDFAYGLVALNLLTLMPLCPFSRREKVKKADAAIELKKASSLKTRLSPFGNKDNNTYAERGALISRP